MDFSDYLVLSPILEDPPQSANQPSLNNYHNNFEHQVNNNNRPLPLAQEEVEMTDKDGFTVPFRKRKAPPQLRVDTSNLISLVSTSSNNILMPLKSPGSRIGSPITPTAGGSAVGVFIDSPRLRYGYGEYHISLSPKINSTNSDSLDSAGVRNLSSAKFRFPSASANVVPSSEKFISSKSIAQRDFVPVVKRKITLGKWRKSVLKCFAGKAKRRTGRSISTASAKQSDGPLEKINHLSSHQQNNCNNNFGDNCDEFESTAVVNRDAVGQCNIVAAPRLTSDPLKVDFDQLSLSHSLNSQQSTTAVPFPSVSSFLPLTVPILNSNKNNNNNLMVDEEESSSQQLGNFDLDTEWMQIFDGTPNIYLPQMISPTVDTVTPQFNNNNFDMAARSQPLPHSFATVSQYNNHHTQPATILPSQIINFGNINQQHPIGNTYMNFYQPQQPQSQPIVNHQHPSTTQDRQKRPYQRHPAPQTTATAETILVDDNGEKRFRCPFEECSHEFIRRHDLLRHIRIHTADKPFRCDRCMKAFTRQDALKRHVVISEKYDGQCRVTRGRVPKAVAESAGQR